MRRILFALLTAAAGLLLVTSNAGCDDNVVTSSARSSFSSFLTGVISGAINGSG